MGKPDHLLNASYEALPPMLSYEQAATRFHEKKIRKNEKVLFVYYYRVTPSEQTFFLWLKIQIWARVQNQTLHKATVTSGALVTVELSFRLNGQWMFPCTEIMLIIIKSRRIYRSLKVWATRIK